MNASPAIAIVGAGIGGLSAAVALRRLGIAAHVYEQAEAFARVGAALQLTPNTMKAARGLGIEDALMRQGFAPAVAHNRKWDTAEITYLHPMGDETRTRYGAADIMIHRAEVHAALAAQLPPDSIHHGRKLRGFSRGDGAIVLSFADGETARADAVIAADGVNSVVRAAVFGADAPRFIGRTIYRAVYDSARIGDVPVDDRVKWWGPDRHLITYRIGPQRQEIYFNAQVPDPDFRRESWSAQGDLRALCAAFSDFHPHARAVLEACPDCTKFAMVERDPMPRWSDGPVIVIGDACHPMLPTMAQGAGAAMEDAVVVARCVADVARGGGGGDAIASAFRRAGATRAERTARVQRESSANVWMKQKPDTDWLYGYDAWTTPLAAF